MFKTCYSDQNNFCQKSVHAGWNLNWHWTVMWHGQNADISKRTSISSKFKRPHKKKKKPHNIKDFKPL